MIITIDGPSGSGTTTTANIVADALGYVWFSAGGDFRALAYELLQQKVALAKNSELIGHESDIIDLARRITIEHDGHGTITANSKDVTPFLDLHEVTSLVHHVAKIAVVREIHNERMREFAKVHKNVVFEGRPTGRVFPQAIKFWLDVDETEAMRRVTAQRGEEVALHNMHRNKMDAEREVEPMGPAPDATIIDTTHIGRDGASKIILDAVAKLAA